MCSDAPRGILVGSSAVSVVWEVVGGRVTYVRDVALDVTRELGYYGGIWVDLRRYTGHGFFCFGD